MVVLRQVEVEPLRARDAPFIGKAFVACVPAARAVGSSKLSRGWRYPGARSDGLAAGGRVALVIPTPGRTA